MMKWHAISRIFGFIAVCASLLACEGANTGRDHSGRTISFQEWRPINPRELAGNIFNAFSGSTLVDAKTRLRDQSVQHEQVTVRNEGIITTQRHIVGGGTWSHRTYETVSYPTSFRRQIEADNPTALKVEFLTIRPLTNPHYLVNGFVSDVSITRNNGQTIKCAVALGAYGGLKPAPSIQTMNNFNELQVFLRASFCGPNQNAANLERRLQNIAFGPVPLPAQ